MRILVVEDEVNAFQYLQNLLIQLRPYAQVVAHLESVEETINWLHQEEPPDLLFLDIQLSDGLSFEIFKHIEVEPPTIFTTAFDQYAIEAFKLNSIDYLLKPIHREDLRRALDKFDRHQPQYHHHLQQQLRSILQTMGNTKKNRFLIKKGPHFEFISSKDIAAAHSEEGLTFLYTFQGKRFLYNNSIEELSASLDSAVFFRINRGQIVNIEAIQKIHPYFNQRLKLETSAAILELEMIVSRAKVHDFKKWIDS